MGFSSSAGTWIVSRVLPPGPARAERRVLRSSREGSVRPSPPGHSRGHQQTLRLDGNDRMRVGIGGLLYLLIGVILAASNEYFKNVDALKPLLSALLAIVLWPLLLLGVNLDIE